MKMDRLEVVPQKMEGQVIVWPESITCSLFLNERCHGGEVRVFRVVACSCRG